MNEPFVSILTVQYNHFELTLQFLESISKIEYGNYEVIVVDNCSQENGFEHIKKAYPETILISTEFNMGFAGGNNVGLEKCKGEAVLFINNDTEVEPDFLSFLVQCWKSIPNLGMVSPRLQYYQPKGIIQYAGATDLTSFTLRNRSLGFGERDSGQYNTTYPTAFIHGAAMLVPQQVIDQVGTMEASFFLYYEEYDWCSRINDAGFEIMYCGEALVYHKESMSVGKESPLKTYYMTRNRIKYALRNSSGIKKLGRLLYLYSIALPVSLLRFIFQGQWALTRAAIRGALFKPSEYENRHRGTANI